MLLCRNSVSYRWIFDSLGFTLIIYPLRNWSVGRESSPKMRYNILRLTDNSNLY